MRMRKVSMPLSTTQALKGDRLTPALRISGASLSSMMERGPQTAPAITLPWPSRNLVPEWMTRSAPSMAGRCNAGEAKQLSTASSTPASWAIAASSAMSHRSVSGLVGVSANSSWVLGRRAAFQALLSVCGTKLDSTPKRANSPPMSLMVEPNMDCEHTTWSPALSKPRHISKMADMPLAVPMADSVPSSAARRCSKLVTVGLEVRV